MFGSLFLKTERFYLGLGALIFSAPIVAYPLTDGDILHWIGLARQTGLSFSFLSGPNDQAHGPLLIWASALFSRIAPHATFSYGLFNVIMGLLVVHTSLKLAKRLSTHPQATHWAGLLSISAISPVYLSHTPMYDWPAAALLFWAFERYWVRLETGSWTALFGAGVGLGLAAMSRFSISIGLGMIFVFGAGLLLKKRAFFVDIGVLLVCIASLTLPWIIAQTVTHAHFLSTFLYDNFGRYIQEPNTTKVYRDYYGFLLYALVGILPFSAHAVAMAVYKPFYTLYKQRPSWWIVTLMWLPCLVLFSFSGHVKLGRYIAYVFPGLLLQIALFWGGDPQWLSARLMRYVRLSLGILIGALSVGFTILIFQFQKEVAQSPLLATAIILLTIGILLLGFLSLGNSPTRLKKIALGFACVYVFFWSVMAYEMTRAPFLLDIHNEIERLIN